MPVYSAKFAIDALVYHVRHRQHQVSKILQQYVCLVEAPLKYKPQVAFQDLPNIESSLSDFEAMLSFLNDLTEQLYAKTRSDQCSSEVKYLC